MALDKICNGEFNLMSCILCMYMYMCSQKIIKCMILILIFLFLYVLEAVTGGFPTWGGRGLLSNWGGSSKASQDPYRGGLLDVINSAAKIISSDNFSWYKIWGLLVLKCICWWPQFIEPPCRWPGETCHREQATPSSSFSPKSTWSGITDQEVKLVTG